MTVDFVRAFVACTFPSPELLLAELSERYVVAAKELGLPSVPMIFALRHGRLSSDHFRTMAHVFEVILCDLPDDALEVKRAVHDVVQWYWAARASRFDAASIATLRELGLQMRASLAFFERADIRAMYKADAKIHAGPLDDIPKLHRAVRHVPDYIHEFGPYEDLTTEASEAANKPLKQIFRL